MDVPDTIEREVLLPAGVARVWAAITEAEQLAAWFGQRASIDLQPGGAVVFSWEPPAIHVLSATLGTAFGRQARKARLHHPQPGAFGVLLAELEALTRASAPSSS